MKSLTPLLGLIINLKIWIFLWIKQSSIWISLLPKSNINYSLGSLTIQCCFHRLSDQSEATVESDSGRVLLHRLSYRRHRRIRACWHMYFNMCIHHQIVFPRPTEPPTVPTEPPTIVPTGFPTPSPTEQPTESPTTEKPTEKPTPPPTPSPTLSPTQSALTKLVRYKNLQKAVVY